MLNQNISNIPWQQLTTPYGRGTDIPRLIEQEAFLGYYYFSFLLLQEATPVFTAIKARTKSTTEELAELLALLKH
ncbi:hypothetical protein [Lysinibacillus fusiformis]|uniref:hypothetical protein n=1 Tax=Lysinibacillus fusiformis TaxID=28031 RepID=UPI00119EAD5B|nr:hypothetical protein [Lysinibacillus fusiformis]